MQDADGLSRGGVKNLTNWTYARHNKAVAFGRVRRRIALLRATQKSLRNTRPSKVCLLVERFISV